MNIRTIEQRNQYLEFLKCKENLKYFINKYCVIKDKSGKLINIHL